MGIKPQYVVPALAYLCVQVIVLLVDWLQRCAWPQHWGCALPPADPLRNSPSCVMLLLPPTATLRPLLLVRYSPVRFTRLAAQAPLLPAPPSQQRTLPRPANSALPRPSHGAGAAPACQLPAHFVLCSSVAGATSCAHRVGCLWRLCSLLGLSKI